MGKEKSTSTEKVNNKREKMTDEEVERELDFTYKLGIASGLKQASEHVMDYAQKLFVMEKDAEAAKMREASRMLDLFHSEAKATYEKARGR